MTTLVKIIRKYYEENSRYESGAPVRLVKELERDCLVLSDLEISDEDIPVLTRFFNTKQAHEQVKRIEINRSSGGKVNQRRTASTLNLNGHKLFKDLLDFVGKCKALEVLTFEHVDIEMPVIFALGKALDITLSPLRWLAFRYCDINGDEGLKELTPYLGRMKLQVLGLECCNLTDQSLQYITSIVKAQENQLDSLYYNATLRLDGEEKNVEILNEATSFVYSQGLVALSLWGNKISGKGILMLTRLLKKNDWLLGLNLAENKINEISMATLVHELKNNTVLQAILLRNNPGLDAGMARTLCSSVTEKSKNVSSSLSEGFARLNVLEPRVSWLLKCWMTLQCEETRDLIQGRQLLMGQSISKSMTRKPLTKESPQDTYLKTYSVFNYLSDSDLSKPSLPVHPSHDRDDDDPVLYDFSGNGNARLSFDSQTRSSVFAGSHAAERYNTTSTLTNSNTSNLVTSQDYDRNDLTSTIKRVKEPFHELLFRPSIGSPQPFKQGAEYDESVDASVDHRPSQRLAKARQQADELEQAIAVPSPPASSKGIHRRSNGDIDSWEYWPDERPRQCDPGRPPSRISMRPKSASYVNERSSAEYVRSSSYRDVPRFMQPKESSPRSRSVSASRDRFRPKAALEEREKERTRSPSPPRRAWCPTSFVTKASDGTRKRISDVDQTSVSKRYSSPAVVSRRKSPAPSYHGNSMGRGSSAPVGSKPTRKSTTAKYDQIATSVLAATRHLEQVSKRLCDVAESLSESATNISHMNNQSRSSIDVTPNRQMRSPSRDIRQINPIFESQSSQLPNKLFSDQEMENVQLEDIVRQRMKARLRDYLSQELQSGWN